MDDRQFEVFLSEVKKQSLMAYRASNVLNEVLKEWESTVNNGRVDVDGLNKEIFRTIHSFLTHACIVSRLIWPPVADQNCFCAKPKAEGRICKVCMARLRRDKLHEALEIPETHILQDRELRNHLEHFDERLDEWVRDSVNQSISIDNIGPGSAIPKLDNIDTMRGYDPYSGEYCFRGELYSMQNILEGIIDILKKPRLQG